jgi:photosystem II stability/assembly factor-like uncharacterized protein
MNGFLHRPVTARRRRGSKTRWLWAAALAGSLAIASAAVALPAIDSPLPAKWQVVGPVLWGDSYRDVSFGDTQHGVVVSPTGILTTLDGGHAWTETRAQAGLRAAGFADATHVCVVGDGGAALTSADGGQTWTPRTSGTTDDLVLVSFGDASHGWALAKTGGVLATANGGASWAPVAPLSPEVGESAGDMVFVDASHGWVADSWDGIWVTDDGGQTWGHQAADSISAMYGVAFIDATRGWGAVPYHVVRTDDGGATWETISTPVPSRSFVDIEATDVQRLWAVTEYGQIYVSGDGGLTWEEQSVEDPDPHEFAGDFELEVIGDHGWTVRCRSDPYLPYGFIAHTDTSGFGDQHAPVTTVSSSTDKDWVSAPVTIGLDAVDDATGVAATYYRTTVAGAWQQGTQVLLTQDGRYEVAYASVDGYGNVEATRTYAVGIDTKPPVTKIFSENDFGVGYWINQTATVEHSVTDPAPSSGVHRTWIDVEGQGMRAWNTNELIIFRAPTDHSNDGVHTIDAYSEDVAGNVEATQLTGVGIDTRRPTVKAPYATSCRSGGYVTVRFKMTDAAPCYPKGVIRIQIKTLSGKIKQTVYPTRWFTKNTLTSYRFRCRVARGKYRFWIIGEDGALNRTLRAAGNYLTVR